MTTENELNVIEGLDSVNSGLTIYDNQIDDAINLIKSQQLRIELLESAIREFLYKPDTKNSFGANIYVENLRNLMEQAKWKRIWRY